MIMLMHVVKTLMKSQAAWRAILFIDRPLTELNELDLSHVDYTDVADLEENRLYMEDGDLTEVTELTLLIIDNWRCSTLLPKPLVDDTMGY